jgi:hypothetical protein
MHSNIRCRFIHRNCLRRYKSSISTYYVRCSTFQSPHVQRWKAVTAFPSTDLDVAKAAESAFNARSRSVTDSETQLQADFIFDKCDEKLPSCTQCLRGKRKCHGSISTIFLNVDSSSMTTTTTYVNRDHQESPKKKQKNDIVWAVVDVGPSSPLDTRQTSPETSRQTSREGSTNSTVHSISNKTFPAPLVFSIPIPIDNSHAITQQCLSKFIHFFARATRRDVIFNSWMARIPSMLASPSQSPLIGRAVMAASLAYYGRYSNDERIIAESYWWYGDGLARQIQTLAIMQREQREPTIEEICAPLMLSFFEITCSTSPTAYFQHLMGAARMLEKHGPEKCSEGVLFALYQTLRLQLVRILSSGMKSIG